MNMIAFVAVGVLFAAFAIGEVADASTYLWLLPSVTIASAALVAVLVHPVAGGAHAVFGSRPLVEIGRRSALDVEVPDECSSHDGAGERALRVARSTARRVVARQRPRRGGDREPGRGQQAEARVQGERGGVHGAIVGARSSRWRHRSDTTRPVIGHAITTTLATTSRSPSSAVTAC